jgi:hypothetical protein
MIRSRLGLKALGACALALSLMAVCAGAAQAEETGGSWTYINAAGQLKTFEGVLAEPEVGGKIETGTVFVLHSEALNGTKVLYECKKFAAFGSNLKPNGIVLGRLVFTECEAFLNGTLSAACNPLSGSIITNLIKAQMLLHKLPQNEKKEIVKDKILIAEGENIGGGPISTLAFIESTDSCALGIKVPVGGRFAIVPSNPSTHEVEHLFKEFSPLTHLWILSDTAEHKANILGSGLAFLEGDHVGLKWAGLWK